jgi:aconitate hydratase
MKPGNKNSFNSKSTININNKDYTYYSISEAEKNGLERVSKLPKSLKVLLENLLRYEDDLTVNKSQITAIKDWLKTKNQIQKLLIDLQEFCFRIILEFQRLQI